jgi:release factor glutamine methyltransferase
MQPKPPNLHRERIRASIAEAEYVLADGPRPEYARRDAETLLLHVLRDFAKDKKDAWVTHFGITQEINRAWLIANKDVPISPPVSARLKALVERRRAGEPMQYILGEAEFYGLPFRVTPEVLIPRPETEHLVEEALKLAVGFERARIVDVGTGSGAIAVSIAHERADAAVTAIDISAAALKMARENAKRNGCDERIRFLQGDLFSAVETERFDLIVSNPPYIPSGDRATLAVEVRDHEPALALFAGTDGLAVYRRLIPAAFEQLELGGFVLMEIGYGQQAEIEGLLAAANFGAIRFIDDLQGIARVACGQKQAFA